MVERLFDVLDESMIRTDAQLAYTAIVKDFRTFKEGDFASFIVATLYESQQGIVNTAKFNDLVGARHVNERITILRKIASELDDMIEIEEFPGYDDWWFSFGRDSWNNVVLFLHVGFPEWGYFYSEESATDIEQVPFISDFRKIFENQLYAVDTADDYEVKLFDRMGNLTVVTRDDVLPFRYKEKQFLLDLVEG